MALPPERRPLARVTLCAFTALALTALAAYLFPGVVLGTHGEATLRAATNPAPLAILVLALIASALFALLWLASVRVTSFPLVAAGLLVLAVPAAAFLGFEMWEYHEEPEFCAETCHMMEPAFEQYENPSANLVMQAHQEDHTALCLDCHKGPGTQGEIDLMLTSAKHVWKAWITKDYDPDDLGGPDWVHVVPDENCLKCHDDGLDAELPDKHGRFEQDCAMCHSPHHPEETGYFFPEKVLENDDCTECHDDLPADLTETMGAHAEVEEGDCRACHVTHGLKVATNVKSCDDASCHSPDPIDANVLDGLDHPSFTVEECQDCHQAAHDLTIPDITVMADSCDDCHSTHEPALQFDGIAHATREGTDCVDCHKKHDLTADNGTLGCSDASCHRDAFGDGLHAEFPEEDCAECHGGPHEPRVPSPATLEETCTDCHSDAPTHSEAGAHAQEACSDCHQVHDLAPATVAPCSDCHSGLPAPHEEFDEADCVDCHGGPHDTTPLRFTDITEDCQDCHADRPVQHTDGGCSDCHTTHDLQVTGAVVDCTTSGCHDQDASNPAAIPGPGHATFDAGDCQDCHGPPHDAHVPTFEEATTVCSDCHGVRLTIDGASNSDHYDLGVEACDSCHRSHDLEDPGAVQSCTDCHSHDAAAPAPLPSQHGDFEDCASCHGSAHALATPEIGSMLDGCGDCHRSGVDPLTVQHGGNACTDCHTTHDGQDPPACTDCHSGTWTTDAGIEHGTFEAGECLACHGPAHDPTGAGGGMPTSDQCTSCHSGVGLDEGDPVGHPLEDLGCSDCHATHDLSEPGAVKTCGTDCHSPADGTLDGHYDFESDPDACITCHAQGHDLVEDPAAHMAENCEQCHTGDDRHDGVTVTTGTGPRDMTCTDCHDTTAGKPAPDLPASGHNGPDKKCQTCHYEGNPQGATLPNTDTSMQGQRDWMRENHRGVDDWTSDGRGAHSAHISDGPSDKRLDCSECHSNHGPDTQAYPDVTACADCHSTGPDATPDPLTCDSRCHQWLYAEDLEQDGFTDSQGATSRYEGNIDPARLLAQEGNKHNQLFNDYGCTGLCHNEALTMEAAQQAWGTRAIMIPIVEGTDPGLPEAALHGTINTCTECHPFGAIFETPIGALGGEVPEGDIPVAEVLGDMHSVHIPFLTAEKPVDDDGSDGFADSCAYCHSSNTPENDHGHDGPGGGCYNCHLSGHDPGTYLWAKGTTAQGPDGAPPHAEGEDCGSCHNNDHPGSQAQFPSAAPGPRSQIAWARASGASVSGQGGIGDTVWSTEGRGGHTGELTCDQCHVGVESTEPYDTDSACTASCHSWLQEPLENEPGFTNADGETATYSGPMDPETMLVGPDPTKHSQIYADNGCTGLCHGGDPVAPHGTVDQCMDCHVKDAVHDTHQDPGYVKDNTSSDPDSPYAGDDCNYCHSQSEDAAGACYNCHVSGHYPRASYWDAGSSGSAPLTGQRDWAQSNGAVVSGPMASGNDLWTTQGRGAHDQAEFQALGLACADCHVGETKQFPSTGECTDCHGWLDTTITQVGYTNILQEESKYEGSLDPQTMLSNGDTAHSQIFEASGCDGLCHGGVEDSTDHLATLSCTDCHDSRDGEYARGVHSTHETGYVMEGALAAPTAPNNAYPCSYCHGQEAPADGAPSTAGGCYNCHVSGHDPTALYWNPPETPTRSEPASYHPESDDCNTCHSARDTTGEPVSQMSWARQTGGSVPKPSPITDQMIAAGLSDPYPIIWTTGDRGSHPEQSTCSDCHSSPDPRVTGPYDEASCDSSCHGWLQEDVEQDGFKPAGSPVTHFSGNIDPEGLLVNTQTDHGFLYDSFGCTGFCHGGDPAATEHGTVDQCYDCHDADALHPTHRTGGYTDDAPQAAEGSGYSGCDFCHGDPEATPGGCYNCHLSGHDPQTVYWDPAEPSTPAVPAWNHAKLGDCQGCHQEDNPLGAPVPDTASTTESQVSWMRKSGGAYGVWNQDGRGAHIEGADCVQCHDPINAPTHPLYPEGDCQSSCHTWLQEEISQDGFTNADGSMTGYKGTLDPETLLTTQGKAHGALFNATGCTGVCHNALIAPRTGAVEGDQSYFEDLATNTAAGAQGAANGADHSYINSCVDCHAVGPFPLDLHGTHAVLVDNERDAGADSESGYDGSCSYCHSSGNPDNTQGDDSFGEGGGCYNCHLSGHSPETVYWSGTPGLPSAEDPDLPHPVDKLVAGEDCAACHGEEGEPGDGGLIPEELAAITFANHATEWPIYMANTGSPVPSCGDCHSDGGRGRGDTPGGLVIHPPVAVLEDCSNCHYTGNGYGAPMPPAEADPESQLSWARASNSGHKAPWPQEGRGTHTDEADCSLCHQNPQVRQPYDEENCDSSCHGWLQSEINQVGFTNANGYTPQYIGSMDPETMLTSLQPTKHTEIFMANGCTGQCHASPQGGPATITSALAGGTEHGVMDQCIDCHGSGEIHGTHQGYGEGKTVGGYTAGWIQANPNDGGDDDDFNDDGNDCSYCHANKGNGLGGACYNCHVSGHFPATVYWSPDGQPGDTEVEWTQGAAVPAQGAQAESPNFFESVWQSIAAFF